MAGSWEPELRIRETRSGCRLTLVGLTYADGDTLQEAADVLVSRVENIVLRTRWDGRRLRRRMRRADREVLAFLRELDDILEQDGDIRDRLFGLTEPADERPA